MTETYAFGETDCQHAFIPQIWNVSFDGTSSDCYFDIPVCDRCDALGNVDSYITLNERLYPGFQEAAWEATEESCAANPPEDCCDDSEYTWVDSEDYLEDWVPTFEVLICRSCWRMESFRATSEDGETVAFEIAKENHIKRLPDENWHVLEEGPSDEFYQIVAPAAYSEYSWGPFVVHKESVPDLEPGEYESLPESASKVVEGMESEAQELRTEADTDAIDIQHSKMDAEEYVDQFDGEGGEEIGFWFNGEWHVISGQ